MWRHNCDVRSRRKMNDPDRPYGAKPVFPVSFFIRLQCSNKNDMSYHSYYWTFNTGP